MLSSPIQVVRDHPPLNMHANTRRRLLRLLFAPLPFALAVSASAQVGNISGPTVDAGAWELSAHSRFELNGDHAHSHRVTFEHGLDDVWLLEIGTTLDKKHGRAFDFSTAFLEVKRELTDQKKGAWLSTGLIGEYYYNLHSGPDAIEFKFLFEKRAGVFTHRLNINLEREIGSGADSEWALESRWFTRWNRDGRVQPALEWHARWGTLENIPEVSHQGHYIGPAVYGELGGGGSGTHAGEWSYQLAWVFGVAQHTADSLLRAQIAWEW